MEKNLKNQAIRDAMEATQSGSVSIAPSEGAKPKTSKSAAAASRQEETMDEGWLFDL